ncbi:hypothetical protein SDC9_105541 [bioreactor metagenome]|uniref:Glycosyltransferase subfamily 4-like N-terminal domain-containing protein n=1 Tax=bioreactor metagenome TaxID=1076179 RepID=A0A645B0Z8_9ZZZZ
MKKNSQTKKSFDVVLLSFLDYKKEGRCYRAYKALSEVSSVYVIDSGDQAVSEENRTFIPKMKSNIKNVINFTRRAISAAGMVSFKTLYVSNFYTAIAALFIRKQTKCRVIYDAYELFYPEGNEHFSKRDQFFYFFEKIIIRKADAVIAANDSRALIMLGYYRLRQMPYVVENISGTPGMLNGVHKKGATCKLVYAGYLSKKRGLAELVEAVQKLGDFHDLSLDIYGAGENIDWFLSLAEIDPHFHYHGTYDNNQLPEILSQYDVGFI